ncbi:MAG: glycerol-3-phosphate acyltransferase [Anaerolineae bacterium]|nr:glycerol-3-phosphate acyltransferase [Anaerolineae bacterium]
MEWSLALLAAAIGYLAGSISFARIVTRLVAPGEAVGDVDLDLPGTEEKVHFSMVSGTTVSIRLGAKWGGITALLDILKVVIPAVVLRFALPGTPYYLIAATLGAVGHNWPVYHRFKGGRGLSPMYGGFLSVAPLGTLVTAIVGMFVGLACKSVLLSYMLGPWLMVPWVWWRTRDVAHVVYVVVANVLFLLALIPDIRGILARKRLGVDVDVAQSMELTPMGRGIRKMGIRLGLLKDE